MRTRSATADSEARRRRENKIRKEAVCENGSRGSGGLKNTETGEVRRNGKTRISGGQKDGGNLAALFLLSGCGSVTEEMKTGRTEGIALLESGDYEGAVSRFDEVISQASRVTDFELDVLKYRAEAELKLEDYQAAAYTYGILIRSDGPKPQ